MRRIKSRLLRTIFRLCMYVIPFMKLRQNILDAHVHKWHQLFTDENTYNFPYELIGFYLQVSIMSKVEFDVVKF